MSKGVWPACLCMHYLCAVPVEARRESQIPGDWNYILPCPLSFVLSTPLLCCSPSLGGLDADVLFMVKNSTATYS